VKQSRKRRLDKIFLLEAALLAATLVPAIPAYAQQEVDPTWYDPWATQPKVVVQPAKSRTHHREPGSKTVSPRTQFNKTRVKPAGGRRQGRGGTAHLQK